VLTRRLPRLGGHSRPGPIEFLHVKPGKGSAFVRSKLKNMISGNVQEKTFRAGEKVDTAEIERSDMQYTYSEGDTYVFMDMQTYEETRLEKSDWAKFLKVEQTVSMVVWDGKVISVDLPKVVELEVTDTDPGLKGNTKDSGGSKPATLETGAIINVPLFISIGEKLIVDSESGDYVSRAKS